MRTREVLRKLVSGELVAKGIMGYYLLDKMSIRSALLQDGELMVESPDGSILGFLYLNEENQLSFLPYNYYLPQSYIES